MERGAHALDYERKTALFSLALSEVVLINLWSNDIGRQNAANLPLLKLVFEVNLLVFQEPGAPKTILMFVIRDHVSQKTSQDVLADRILKDMRQIWADIPKPGHFSKMDVTDVFEFTFAALSHYHLERPNFEKDVSLLRNRFTDASDRGFLFHRAHPKVSSLSCSLVSPSFFF